jgi:hypothetical protein
MLRHVATVRPAGVVGSYQKPTGAVADQDMAQEEVRHRFGGVVELLACRPAAIASVRRLLGMVSVRRTAGTGHGHRSWQVEDSSIADSLSWDIQRWAWVQVSAAEVNMGCTEKWRDPRSWLLGGLSPTLSFVSNEGVERR